MSFRFVARHAHALLLAVLLCALAPFAHAQHKTYTVTAPDGVAIAVQEWGRPDGPPIVFVHGLLGSHLNWDAQVRDPALQGYRLITFDLRGHGASGKPTDAAAYRDGQRWAGDLAAVLAASGAREPVLVGWSLGAAVITNYLASHGDGGIAGALYVGGVIELDPALILPHPTVYAGLLATDLRTHLDAERTFLALCFHTPPPARAFERLLAAAALASFDMQQAVMHMQVAAAQALPAMRKPLLLVYGEQEALVKPDASIARARALNPQVQRRLYAASGHAPFVEEAARFNADLLGFARAVGR